MIPPSHPQETIPELLRPPHRQLRRPLRPPCRPRLGPLARVPDADNQKPAHVPAGELLVQLGVEVEHGLMARLLDTLGGKREAAVELVGRELGQDGRLVGGALEPVKALVRLLGGYGEPQATWSARKGAQKLFQKQAG